MYRYELWIEGELVADFTSTMDFRIGDEVDFQHAGRRTFVIVSRRHNMVGADHRSTRLFCEAFKPKVKK